MGSEKLRPSAGMGSKPTSEEIRDRVAHHPPTEQAVTLHQMVRATTLGAMESYTDWLPGGRELSLALTKLEEAMFWANAAIARNLSPINPDEPLQSLRGTAWDRAEAAEAEEPGYDEQVAGVGLENVPSGRVEVIPASQVEERVGARRHPDRHILTLHPDRWDILHSGECFDSGRSLERCAFTVAAQATDFEVTFWRSVQGAPIFIGIDKAGHIVGKGRVL